jgi:hypothetical protein
LPCGGNGTTPDLRAAIGVFIPALLQVAMAIWSIVVMAKTVGPVQVFSAWRALGNFFLVGLLGLAVLLLIFFAVGVLAR